ncbi:TetR/AcrR family transcriptional regulator [Cellulomonas sp. PhB143]|uniref:TetR/AcrR family transcriptional regulator n=1 Tax=Cellulomonas sp. PhB143 TaxID=2485186 RepID=UPI000F48FD67|nr:TetR/AcrR family transcriptional regulator [Cellulomonas sp. PhB143]ROS78917.1 TetR family transcriptional regulator [Cellulomonas sp. PhB143]
MRSRAHHEAVDAAVELFMRQGYERTTVEEIADAAGISRATFFRRYGSKEDVVFADHEVLLEDVVVLLAESRHHPETADPFVEVCRAARLVFDHHVSQPETSVARHHLLQQVPSLRDRELVTTHRYERAFTRYLRESLPAQERAATTSVAFAASVVAVHNAILRRWLRDPALDLRPALEEAFGDLRRGASRTVQGAAGSSGADSSAEADGAAGASRRVVVAVVDAPGGPGPADADAVARAVRDALA